MPFISIQLNSNRPEQLARFLNSIEATADAPQDIEVLLHIDEGDTAMEVAVAQETHKRTLTLRTLQTNLVTSYATLWMPLNPLLKMTHPDAYFVINVSDEMLFETKGWDSIIRRYVGFYPDNIFRLRGSKYRFRNYTDFWECGFAPDSLAFYTHRWLELSGDWNPCLGPDSFQQCVAFYLFTADPFLHEQYYRDIPLTELQFSGEGAGVDLKGEAKWKRTCINMRAWFTLMSHRMQQEAKRRAMRIKSHIIADKYAAEQNVEVIEDIDAKCFSLRNKETNAVLGTVSYRLSWLRITLTNISRMPNVLYYNGSQRGDKKTGPWRSIPMSCAVLFATCLPLTCGPKLLTTAERMARNLLGKPPI